MSGPQLRVVKVGPLGSFGNNAYVIIDPATNESIIVDMPEEGEQVLAAAQGTKVTRIMLTHDHHDHWHSYDLIRGATGAPVCAHPSEVSIAKEKIDIPLSDGEELPVGQGRVRVIHTPGHTPGSVCLLVGDRLISGDTLFPGGPGHSRTPGALQESIRSIVDKLYVLPDATAVLPGHGDATTIGQSKREYAVFASRPHPPGLCGDVLWESS